MNRLATQVLIAIALTIPALALAAMAGAKGVWFVVLGGYVSGALSWLVGEVVYRHPRRVGRVSRNEVVVTVKADTTEFDRAIRKAARRARALRRYL